MAPSLRDRISVDLRGLKPSLLARASAQSVLPSDLVRRILSDALYRPQLQQLQMPGADSQRQLPQRGERSRLFPGVSSPVLWRCSRAAGGWSSCRPSGRVGHVQR
jgi:hypothetical protein